MGAIAEDFFQSYLQDCVDVVRDIGIFDGEFAHVIGVYQENMPSTYLECIFFDIRYFKDNTIDIDSRVGDISAFFNAYPGGKVQVNTEPDCRHPFLGRYMKEVKDLPGCYQSYLEDYLIYTGDYNLAKKELDYIRNVPKDGTQDIDRLLRLRIRYNIDGSKIVTVGRDLLVLDLDEYIRYEELGQDFNMLLEQELELIKSKKDKQRG
ncbi:hypothetical protein [Pseudogracilibacillus auburnensis]|uniref:hypothetical protein n=1 Tax=Pseudogracilibacillus auburnensis TaxID=1494959 RepID=UPI001A96BDCB|nr:hypothetical protein [Pseudogracilibacillus auburnensis]MBO1005919.1 hypothetical protein [Pseudogracilibacillus auburnensis]